MPHQHLQPAIAEIAHSPMREIPSPQHTAQRLEQLTACFLRFGTDCQDNIQQLTVVAGQLLRATCASYTRLQEGRLMRAAHWHVSGAAATAHAHPHQEEVEAGCLCGDVIRQGGEAPVLIQHLQDTVYTTTDPMVTRDHLRTWMGQTVRIGSETIGALCLASQRDAAPSEEDQRILVIIASAIGIEEQRRQAETALAQEQQEFERLQKLTMAREDRVIALKREVNALQEELGRPAKYRV